VEEARLRLLDAEQSDGELSEAEDVRDLHRRVDAPMTRHVQAAGVNLKDGPSH
jgi:hypothetical protein